MTGPASDAAGRESAAAELSPPDHPLLLDLVARLRQRWWLMAPAVVVALIGAGVYLAVATPQYHVTAILMAESAGADTPPEFLAAQRRALLAPPVQSDDVGKFNPTVQADQAERTLTISIETDRP